MASTIQVRVDDELKRKSDIKKNSRAEYSPYDTMTEEKMLAKLKSSREQCEMGRYCEADKVVANLRGKYGL